MRVTRSILAASTACLCFFATSRPVLAAPQAPTAAVAVVDGSAQFEAAGSGAWIALVAGQRLRPGDSVKTAASSKVIVAFSDGSKIQVGENATLALQDLKPRQFSLRLAVGLLDAWVAHLRHRRFEVRTPTAVAAVRGTVLEVAVDESGNTQVSCFTGLVQVTQSAGQFRPVMVRAHQTLANITSAPTKVAPPVAMPVAKLAPVEPKLPPIPPPPPPAPAPPTPGVKQGQAPPAPPTAPPAGQPPAPKEGTAQSQTPPPPGQPQQAPPQTETAPPPPPPAEPPPTAPPPPPPPSPEQTIQTAPPPPSEGTPCASTVSPSAPCP